jgi:hypothetical protein
MRKYLLILLPVLMLGACKDKKNVENAGDAAGEVEISQPMVQENPYPVNPIKLPNPCALIDLEELTSIFDVEVEEIVLTPGNVNNNPGQDNNLSCFYMWDKDAMRGGFLLQIMKNPLYGEFTDWASSYMRVLKENGETSYPDNIQYKYAAVEGLGDEAVYNKDLGKVFWRIGEELVVGLIYRDTQSIGDMPRVSKDLGKLINPRIVIEKE